MKVLLIADVKKIGRRGEVKDVADGFAHNFLIPQKKALKADSGEAKKFLESLNNQSVKVSAEEARILQVFDGEVIITVSAKANEKGHLYKAIAAKEVAVAICALYPEIPDAEKYVLPLSLKEVGEYQQKIAVRNQEKSFLVRVIASK